MINNVKLVFNYLLKIKNKEWLNVPLILAMVLGIGSFGFAEVNLVTEELQNISETKPLIKTTTTKFLTEISQPIDNKNSNNFVEGENLIFSKEECFNSNFRSLFNENRNQLRKIQIEHRKLYYLTISTAEKIRLVNEYKSKVKNLQQDFLLKVKEIKENCQNKFNR